MKWPSNIDILLIWINFTKYIFLYIINSHVHSCNQINTSYKFLQLHSLYPTLFPGILCNGCIILLFNSNALQILKAVFKMPSLIDWKEISTWKSSRWPLITSFCSYIGNSNYISLKLYIVFSSSLELNGNNSSNKNVIPQMMFDVASTKWIWKPERKDNWTLRTGHDSLL